MMPDGLSCCPAPLLVDCQACAVVRENVVGPVEGWEIDRAVQYAVGGRRDVDLPWPKLRREGACSGVSIRLVRMTRSWCGMKINSVFVEGVDCILAVGAVVESRSLEEVKTDDR